jgi:transposase
MSGTSSPRRADLPADWPASLSQVNLHAAGIDVGAESHWVAVPLDRANPCVREFGAFTADLHTLAEWLKNSGVRTVAMESTGVYWIPLFELLEQEGFEVLLVDPHGLKSVPGRKTDVLDCQWLQQLHTYGLLRGAFRPDEQVCSLRAYLRQRSMLVRYASQHIQHMQKALTQMNLKLQQVLGDIDGATGLRIIRAILGGQRDPRVLAQLRDVRCKHDEATIAGALEGNYRAEHLFELQQALELYEVYQEKMAACDRQIQACLKTFASRTEEPPPLPDPHKPKQSRKGPAFELRSELWRISRVDLTRIDGIDNYTALKILSELGPDLVQQFPTSRQFASWLGLCPGNKISGGKRLSGRTKPCANRVAGALRVAASTLWRSNSYLGAYLRRMKGRLGAPKAITATAHKLARLIYSLLKYGQQYLDLGQDYYERQYQHRLLRNLTRRAEDLGYHLVPIPPAQPQPVAS